MNTSLSKFCKDHDLPKSSVYRRCQELSWDVSDGLTAEQCDRLRHEFDAAFATELRSVPVAAALPRAALGSPTASVSRALPFVGAPLRAARIAQNIEGMFSIPMARANNAENVSFRYCWR